MRDLNEFLKIFTPKDHNSQDLLYLEARYNWTVSIGNHSELYEKMTQEYKGTTFEIKNFPDRYKIGVQGKCLFKNHVQNDRSRQAQQPLF